MSRRRSTNQLTLDVVLHFSSTANHMKVTNKKSLKQEQMCLSKKNTAILDLPVKEEQKKNVPM